MAKSKTKAKKSNGEHPAAAGADKKSAMRGIGVRLDLVRRVDEYAKKLEEKHGISLKRTAVVNSLIEQGLKAAKV